MPLNVTPLPTAQAGYPGQSLTIGQPAAEAQANVPDAAPADAKAPATSSNIRKIKMHTKTASVEKAGVMEAATKPQETPPTAQEMAPAATEAPDLTTKSPPTEAPAQEIAPAAPSDKTDAEEDTKPLGPQYAALARHRRALDVKEKQLQAREKALTEKASSPDANSVPVSRLKSEPLSVLREAGVTYDQLTEAILAEQNGITPQFVKLQDEVKSLKEELTRTLSDRDAEAEQVALVEIGKEATRLAKTSGDEFELIRATNSIPDVVALIERTFKSTGEALDVADAMQLVEAELVKDGLQIAQAKKVQERIKPKVQPSASPAPAAPAQTEQQQTQPPMKTLTSRGTVTANMSRRDRAIAAATGLLKK